ncbi:MAG: P1 family peptidase [Actinobacteria bacterium]|nr:P1 family peptidase [Actinomycetota bacterium]
MVARFADLLGRTGTDVGLLPSGPTRSVHDVPGVGLGHATFTLDGPAPPHGPGTVRTGVSVLHLPGDLFGSPVPAGGAVLNGAGECTGFVTVTEWGRVETPVFLTSTMSVGRVYDAACLLLAEQDERVGRDDVVIPVVAECDDSGLSDPRRFRPTDEDVARAWAAARAGADSGAPPDEGCVGAGTGMECLGFKGGIGTASRLLPDGHVLGAVVLTNFGSRERLTVCGVPVGRLMPDGAPADAANDTSDGAPADAAQHPDRGDRGSCIVVLVTDGPLDAHACGRLARRAGMGLARTGSVATHGSGEIFLALATGLRGDRVRAAEPPPVSGRDLDPYFAAAVEATEEAVLTALLAATTTTGRDGRRVEALPLDAVADLVRRASQR